MCHSRAVSNKTKHICVCSSSCYLKQLWHSNDASAAVVATQSICDTRELYKNKKQQRLYLSIGKNNQSQNKLVHILFFWTLNEEILVASYSALEIFREVAWMGEIYWQLIDPVHYTQQIIIRVTLCANIPIVDYHSHMNILWMTPLLDIAKHLLMMSFQYSLIYLL